MIAMLQRLAFLILIFLTVGIARPAHAQPRVVTVGWDDGIPVGLRGDVEVWRWPDYRQPREGIRPTILHVASACVLIQHGAIVDLVDLQTGVATDRIVLPDATAMTWGEGVAEVDGPRWSGAVEVSCGAGFAQRPPLWPALSEVRDWQAWDEAQLPIHRMLHDGAGPEALRALDEDDLVALRLRYDALIDQVPTNPWYRALAAHLATISGAPDVAAMHLDALLAGPPDPEWVRMAQLVDQTDATRGDQLFEAGTATMVARGYVPELSTSALAFVLMVGGAPPLGTAAERIRWAGRLWRVAPWTEGAHLLYQAVAEDLDGEEAARWAARASEARRRDGERRWTRYARSAGRYLNLMLASVFALALLFLVAVARQCRRLAGRGLRMSHVAAVRLSLAAFIASVSIGPIAQGIGELGVTVTMPTEVVTGAAGTPEFEAYWEASAPSSARDVLLGIAAEARGDLADALRWYGSADTDAGHANAARLLQRIGEEEAADAHRAAVDAESEAMAHYVRGAVALPTDWALQALVHERVRAQAAAPTAEVNGLLRALQRVDDLVVFDAVVFAVLLIVFVARLVMGRRREAPPARCERRRLPTAAWAVGAAVPGGAWHWHVVGPLVTIGVLYAWIAWWALLQSGGDATNLIDMLYALPNGPFAAEGVTRWSGAEGVTRWLGQHALGVTVGVWALGGLAEVVWPDPRGPRGAERNGQAVDPSRTHR